MDCQILRRNVPLFKRLFLCILLICLVGLGRSHNDTHSIHHNFFEKQELLVDVEKLQTVASCKYTVEPFKLSGEYSKFQEFLPKKLYHVKCAKRELSERCLCEETNSQYKCIQTYKKFQIPHIKHLQTIYTGCVCAYQRQNSTNNEEYY